MMAASGARRGLLLNAYAFWQIGQIALYAAIAAFVGGCHLLGSVHHRLPAHAPHTRPGRAATR
jgi:hypothetical protein